MGKPTPGFDVCVVDDHGTVLGPRQEGHVAVRVAPERPVGLFREYWRDPEATAGASVATGTTPGTAPRWTRTATSGSWGAPTT
jgi:acyl-coenzyme A synthetase/AMP-(fatty) acid ligase